MSVEGSVCLSVLAGSRVQLERVAGGDSRVECHLAKSSTALRIVLADRASQIQFRADHPSIFFYASSEQAVVMLYAGRYCCFASRGEFNQQVMANSLRDENELDEVQVTMLAIAQQQSVLL